MRSLRDLLRHYDAVNDEERPRYPMRFAGLLFLAVAGAAVVFLASLTGPGADGPHEVGSQDDDAASQEARAKGIEIAPYGSGWYVGFPIDMARADVDAAALERAVASWLEANPGHRAVPVTHEGLLYGYEMRPVGDL